MTETAAVPILVVVEKVAVAEPLVVVHGEKRYGRKTWLIGQPGSPGRFFSW